MKFASRLVLALVVVCMAGSLAVAADPVPGTAATTAAAVDAGVKSTGPGIGMGLSVIGAGVGIGIIGFSALASMARQPEMAGRISGSMILLAALVEGAAVISLALCFLIGR